MVNLFFLILISSLFFVVSNTEQSSKSTGNLKKDWEKVVGFINESNCDYTLECIKRAMKKSVNDVAVIIENFYDYRKQEYLKNIQFDIQYSHIVENYFKNVSEGINEGINCEQNDEGSNDCGEKIKNAITNTSEWKNTKTKIIQNYQNDFEIVIEECLSLVKELIYYKDNNFTQTSDLIKKNKGIDKFKEEFYDDKIESFINLSFEALYNLTGDLYQNVINIKNITNQYNCKYLNQMNWVLFINCSQISNVENTNTFSRIALLKTDKANTTVCSVPYPEKNTKSGEFTFTFADNCKESLSKGNYNVAMIQDLPEINLSIKHIFTTVTVYENAEINENAYNFSFFEGRYILLDNNLAELNSNDLSIIYSLNHEKFQSKSISQINNLDLGENSNDLRIVIYEGKNDTIKFACEHCIYSKHDRRLETDWTNLTANLGKLSENETNLTEFLTEIFGGDAQSVGVIRDFYRKKMNDCKIIFQRDIETNLEKEIEQIINNQIYKIMFYQQNTENLCTEVLKQSSLQLSEILFNKYKNIYQTFLDEGKSLMKSKIYVTDPDFEDTFDSIIKGKEINNSTLTTVFYNRLRRVIDLTVQDKESILSTKINEKCFNNSLNNKNYFSNSIECFKFLKIEIVQWAVTLSLEIIETKQTEPKCKLSSETIFFLTTLDEQNEDKKEMENIDNNMLTDNTDNNETIVGNLDDNKVICKIGMKKVKVNGNILYINFKQGSCEHFPYPNIDTYYLGMYAQDKTTGIYSKIIVYPNTSIKYYDYFPINSTKILNYSVKAGKCTIPRDIQLRDENLSDKYIEYSFDANDFAFENKEPIHNLGNQIKDNLSLIIYDEEGKIIFAAKGCEYKGKFELSDCHKEHTESYIDSGTFTTCICKEGFYGDKCENEVTNSSPSGFNEQLYDILSDSNFIVDVNKHSATVNTQKLNTLKNLIEMTNQLRKENSTSTSTEAINITQINTLNSITENYLTNSKPDTTSIYLLTLAINANLIKLKQKRLFKLRQLEDINEPEAMITHKIEHLLHLATIHYSTMNITDQKESILTLIPNNIYVHQWTCHSYQKAYDTTNKYHLTYIDPDIICEDDKSNPTYTVIELPRNITKDIYASQTASNIVSFYIRSPSDKEYANVKLSIPTSGMYIQSNITDNNNHIVEVYSAESPFFTDKCYRGDFDFDITERVKVDLLDGFKVMKSISNGCYPSHFNPSTERATLTCYSDMDLMVGFTISDYGNLTETGSIFECSTDIKDIEKNIAFWLYLLILLISICLIIFYLVIKYGNESKDELLKIETALENDGILRDVDQPQPINVMSETGKKSERDEVVGNVADPNKINVELNENTFVKMFIKNLFELHPIITTVTPSVITPLSMRIAFFAFNLLTLFGFNAVFFTNDYLFERYKHKDRDKFVYSIRDEFGKMISAIVCTMAVSALMRLIIIVTLKKKKEVEKKIKENIEHIHVVKEFRKDMLLNRCICVFVMMIITAWFFYFSIAWCNRYPKAQHSWGHACAWSIMFNYILFSTVYIVIITAVQMKDSCEKCTYYMKRTFMF